jgi:3-oxoadipate enol-lactonase
MDTRAEADTAEGRKARDAAAALARDRGAEAVTESLLPRVLGRSTRTGASITAERVRGMMSSTPVSGLVGALAAMRDRPDSSPLLPELAGLPTLVLVGEEDELTPPDTARAMADRIPGARLVTIPGSGHLPPVERPVETTRALLEFLRTLR